MRTATSLILFLCPLLALAETHAHDARLQRRHAHKQRAELSRLENRGTRATFFDVGLGACGKTNSGDEHVIALTHLQWDGGSHCFQDVTISFGGKTTTAKIVDECMGCPYNGIDMSRGLFDFFSSESAGVLSVDWSFGGGGGGGGDDEPKPSPTKEKPSPKPTPTSTSSTSTWSEPKTSSTWSSSSTKSSSTSTSTSTTSTSTVASTSSTPIPTPTYVPAGPQNLADLDSLVAALGHLVASSGQ